MKSIEVFEAGSVRVQGPWPVEVGALASHVRIQFGSTDAAIDVAAKFLSPDDAHALAGNLRRTYEIDYLGEIFSGAGLEVSTVIRSAQRKWRFVFSGEGLSYTVLVSSALVAELPDAISEVLS